MRRRIPEVVRQVLQRQVARNVLLHIMDHLRSKRLVGMVRQLAMTVGLYMQERRQEGVQAHGRMNHVLAGKCHREAVVYGFEQLQAILQTRLVVGQNRTRHDRVLEEVLRQCPLKMHPVDTPRPVVVRPEPVGGVGRQQDEMMGLQHLLCLAVQLIPAAACHTIDQHTIVHPLVLLYIMVLHLGEIAQFPYIERAHQRHLAIFAQDVLRQRQHALSFESFLYSGHAFFRIKSPQI